MKKLFVSLAAALIACSVTAQIPVWPTPASSEHLNARMMYGPIPLNNSAGLLAGTTILSTPTGSAQIMGGDCGTLAGANNGSSTLTNATVRLCATLPGWDGSALICQLWLTSCGNEPTNHVASFALKAAALGNGNSLTNLTFGPTQNVSTNVSQNTITLANFAPINAGGAYETYNSATPNTRVVFDLIRSGSDSFTNTVMVTQIAVSYSKFTIPSQ